MKSQNYVLEAVYQGNVVGTQGKRTPPRTIYEFTYNGETHRIAVQVGSNGYIDHAVQLLIVKNNGKYIIQNDIDRNF